MLIPKRAASDCPAGAFDCFDEYRRECLCFCEDHCSWKKCTLYETPHQCIPDENAMWAWDKTNRHWVAQYKGEYYVILYHIIQLYGNPLWLRYIFVLLYLS